MYGSSTKFNENPLIPCAHGLLIVTSEANRTFTYIQTYYDVCEVYVTNK
jgi:hypothetical protein